MRKILLIEDDDELSENLSEILQLSGYQVIRASNGKEGVEKALKERPDLILCDVVMPNLDGYSVLHILSRHPETFSTPFIFLTGRLDEADVRKGMGMGADDYLLKPFDEKDLLNTIEVRLRKSDFLKGRTASDQTPFVDFLENINQAENIDLITSRDVHHFKKRHILYNEGETPMFVYFVVEGKLKKFLINEDGKELITNMYTSGDIFGYKAIFDDVPYVESVEVLEDADLILIPKADFIRLINTDRQIARRFIKLLAHNVIEKEEQLLNLAYSSLRKKVAKGIIDIIDKFQDEKNGKPAVHLSREDLSNMIGSAPESTIRTLKEFRMENLIDIAEDGSIRVLNEKKLRHLQY
ncbi:response regulator [Arcticibacter sp.]|uniref:response regulator n=1 Tax=Arcticibacter sp. TaxID=1872630 RepID=UPI00388E3AA2